MNETFIHIYVSQRKMYRLKKSTIWFRPVCIEIVWKWRISLINETGSHNFSETQREDADE